MRSKLVTSIRILLLLDGRNRTEMFWGGMAMQPKPLSELNVLASHELMKGRTIKFCELEMNRSEDRWLF